MVDILINTDSNDPRKHFQNRNLRLCIAYYQQKRRVFPFAHKSMWPQFFWKQESRTINL